MKPGNKRGAAAPGTRSGPRARAFTDRQYASRPYGERQAPPAERFQGGDRREGPPGRPPRAEGGERESRQAMIALDPDVARVFRTSDAVNEALRLVLRLARVASGRPGGAFRGTGGPPRERGAGFRNEPRTAPRDEQRGPRKPRFGNDE